MPEVIWIEDEPNSIRYELILAKNHGWQITLADNADKALCLLNNQKFDLAVLDLILPKDEYNKERGHVAADTGIELVRSIRKSDRSGITPSNVRLLIITAVVSPNQKLKIANELTTENDYLTKPLIEKEFLNTINRITKDLEDLN